MSNISFRTFCESLPKRVNLSKYPIQLSNGEIDQRCFDWALPIFLDFVSVGSKYQVKSARTLCFTHKDEPDTTFGWYQNNEGVKFTLNNFVKCGSDLTFYDIIIGVNISHGAPADKVIYYYTRKSMNHATETWDFSKFIRFIVEVATLANSGYKFKHYPLNNDTRI